MLMLVQVEMYTRTAVLPAGDRAEGQGVGLGAQDHEGSAALRHVIANPGKRRSLISSKGFQRNVNY